MCDDVPMKLFYLSRLCEILHIAIGQLCLQTGVMRNYRVPDRQQAPKATNSGGEIDLARKGRRDNLSKGGIQQ